MAGRARGRGAGVVVVRDVLGGADHIALGEISTGGGFFDAAGLCWCLRDRRGEHGFTDFFGIGVSVVDGNDFGPWVGWDLDAAARGASGGGNRMAGV